MRFIITFLYEQIYSVDFEVDFRTQAIDGYEVSPKFCYKLESQFSHPLLSICILHQGLIN